VIASASDMHKLHINTLIWWDVNTAGHVATWRKK